MFKKCGNNLFSYQKINSEPPATTKRNDIDRRTEGRTYVQADGPTNVRKDKWTDGQTDETMTATNALGECYWPIDIGLKMRGQ